MEQEYLVVIPAYGKVLESKEQVQEHYDNNKDFQIMSLFHKGGNYINKSDVEKFGNPLLEIRYGRRDEKVIIL